MIFEKEKLRDSHYEAKFKDILARIQVVRATNSFMAYQENRFLPNELKSLYKDNLKEYEQKYRHGLSRLALLKNQIKEYQSANLADKAFLSRIVSKIPPIEAGFEKHNYEENEAAGVKTEELLTKLNSARSDFRRVGDELNSIRSFINSKINVLWLEEYEAYGKKVDELETLLRSGIIPTSGNVNKLQSIVFERVRSIEDAIEKLKSWATKPNLLEKVEALERPGVSIKQYRLVKAEVIKFAKKKRNREQNIEANSEAVTGCFLNTVIFVVLLVLAAILIVFLKHR